MSGNRFEQRKRRKEFVVGAAWLIATCCIVLAPAIAAAATQNTAAEFQTIDTNDDDRVSSSEYEVYTRILFDEIDSDGDYKLSKKEIMASEVKFNRHVFTTGKMLGPADLTTAERIERLDVNRDGTVSRDEHANAAAAKFQKRDSNDDGELSQQEFDAGG